MSCYEWERGVIKLSCKEFPKFKKAFRDQWNSSLESAHARACKLRETVLAKFKGKRGMDWFVAVRDHETVTDSGSYYFPATVETILGMDHGELMMRSMGYLCGESYRGRPKKPRKKDFPKATNKTRVLSMGEASVTFDDQNRTVVWSVSENNHACERARGSMLGRIFFKLLSGVQWTRDTGGVIFGNDEYNRDSDFAGGGGNFIKNTYGPRGRRESGVQVSIR